jgi:ornithine decarboxylase
MLGADRPDHEPEERMLQPTIQFPSVTDVITNLKPREPVYCIYPHLLRRDVQQFIRGFPGRVMYAVKANPDPRIVQHVLAAGITDVDAASVEEMELVHGIDVSATCYFMAPVRLRGAVRAAYTVHGVRNFVVDHADELHRVVAELPGNGIVIFVRMATNNPDATYNLSEKFGASHADTVALLREVADIGMQPALAFNTGSLVRRPAAFVAALEQSQAVLEEAGVAIRQLDVGGGFPSDYPGMKSEPWQAFFDAIDSTRQRLPLLRDLELHAEPGRALIANGMSLLVQVLHRAGTRLYLNDGIWGSMIEPVLSKGELRYPSRVFRDTMPVTGDDIDYEVFGPTCDSMDRLPAPLPLPNDIAAGDYIEFGTMGAYSLSNRTHFNGFFPNNFVELTGADSIPPPVI